MARGLLSQWKQLVYIDFDNKVTRKILLNIITSLHKISFNVVAGVSDCEASNIGLWKELGVDMNNTCFEHPESKKYVAICLQMLPIC